MSILAFVEEIEQMMKKEGFDMETVLTRRSGPELLSILRFQRTQAWGEFHLYINYICYQWVIMYSEDRHLLTMGLLTEFSGSQE